MLLSRTLLLKSEPAGNLASLDELFALANAMEREAADRYTALSEEMQRQGRRDLAEVFARLAAAEREHVDSVARWSTARTGHAPDAALVRWRAPETFEPEAASEIHGSRLMTPYRALAMAVRNEERAFAFWSYVAAFTDNADVKTASEAMAREELGHVATLRKERRRAYHTRMSAEIAGLVQLPAALVQAESTVIAEALVDAYLDHAERATDPEQLDRLQRLASRAIARLAWLRSLG